MVAARRLRVRADFADRFAWRADARRRGAARGSSDAFRIDSWREGVWRARDCRVCRNQRGGREFLREFRRADRFSIWTLLLHWTDGAQGAVRSRFVGVGVCRNGLYIVDSRKCDRGRRKKSEGLARRDDPARGIVRDGGVGCIARSRVGDGASRVGLAERRSVLRRADQQLPRLVSYCVHSLSNVCTYLRKESERSANADYGRLAVLFYGVSAGGNMLLAIPRPNPAVVADATGALWKASDIINACALVTVFTMGAFTVFAWIRLGGKKSA